MTDTIFQKICRQIDESTELIKNVSSDLKWSIAEIQRLRDENATLREALSFTLKAAEQLYQPDLSLTPGLDPTFYHTLSYDGDLELIVNTKKARAALEQK